MFKRTITVMVILAAILCAVVKADATPRFTKDDTWLVYWYICGADLEEDSHTATRNIAEMQQVKLPPNIKVLIAAGGTKFDENSGIKIWHHPTIRAGGDGIYLYNADNLEKQVDWNENTGNMGAPDTLKQFLNYGEENFAADHRILIFFNHGGVNGICYDENFDKDRLTYDELKSVFTAVYGDSPEELPFELIGFDACVTGSYELANSIADFSRYMIGSEPSQSGWHYTPWLAALANNPSMNGAQIGKNICNSAMKKYDAVTKRTNGFSVIDLSKMPELRGAYEAYFNEALSRSYNEDGFSAAFARAAENRNIDKYSNWYTDLGLLAENTKPIMPDTSEKLLKAIDEAVVYNKRGSYLNGKGISTYYPYISEENPADSGLNYFEFISEQGSSYSAQKSFYENLLGLDVSNLEGDNTVPIVPIERKRNGHLFAQLTPEQLENVSSIKCMLLPVNETGEYQLGGAALISADDLTIDWNKGTVTENFRAVEPMLDGHRIAMYPAVIGRGYTFYIVPILYNTMKRDLIVRYRTSEKKYEIIGFGKMIENGMMREDNEQPLPGAIIVPLYWIVEDNDNTENVAFEDTRNDELGSPIMQEYIDPQNNEIHFVKQVMGEPFVFTRDSAITDRPIRRGIYAYSFIFSAPNGDNAFSYPCVISVENGKVFRFTTEEFKAVAEANK